jgi:hypothetical protein
VAGDGGDFIGADDAANLLADVERLEQEAADLDKRFEEIESDADLDALVADLEADLADLDLD